MLLKNEVRIFNGRYSLSHVGLISVFTFVSRIASLRSQKSRSRFAELLP